MSKMPKLPDFSKMLEIGSTHSVVVTHINDPSSFYVRLISSDKILEQLEILGEPINRQQLAVRKRVIYKSSTLNNYVRGELTKICVDGENLMSNIYAIDYGCHDKDIALEQIYLPASDISTNCLPLALHCRLHLCEPKGDTFGQEAIDAMKFFIGNLGEHMSKITIHSKLRDQYKVELLTLECPDDVATMLAMLHHTVLLSNTSQLNRFKLKPVQKRIEYKYKDLKVGDRLIVRVQSGDTISSFYVANMDDYKNYISESPDFNQYCKGQPVEDVVEAAADGRCCGINLRGTLGYQRGFVIRVTEPDNKAMAKLVDTGKEVEVNFCDIKCFNSEFYVHRPVTAIYCSSTEEQVWKTTLPKFLYPGYQFIIEIVEVNSGSDVPHKVNIYPMSVKGRS